MAEQEDRQSVVRDDPGGNAVDRETFFAAMSAFPTGVTVVTTLDVAGKPCGLTCSAFLSVSAEPPLVLVSVDQGSNTLQALRDGRGFVVNFLAAGRGELALAFASKRLDKFAGTPWAPAAGGLPVLHEDAIGYVVCEKVDEIAAGDHVLFLGRVQEANPPAPNAVPLLYFRRTFDAWPVVESD